MFHLGVDLSNPSAVVITATTAVSLENSATTTLFEGATLQLFFTSDLTGAPVTDGLAAGTLRPFSAAFAYDTWTLDDTIPGIFSDLNLFLPGDPETSPSQVFGNFFQAFVGSSTINLSDFTASFPVNGTTGPIYAGYSDNLGPMIGTWEVTAVPTPVPELPVAAHLGLYGAGLLGFLAHRRFRKH